MKKESLNKASSAYLMSVRRLGCVSYIYYFCEVFFFAAFDAFLPEFIRTFIRKKILRSNIPVHKRAVTCPESMRVFAQIIKKYTTIVPKNVFEIGANYAQDAEGLRHYFNLDSRNIWVFEAHPQMREEINKMYSFNCIGGAVFDKSQKMIFNMIDLKKAKNNGISSLMSRSYKDDFMLPIEVQTFRMDDFMEENSINEIDFLKLDVEGANYQVLTGFGEKLKNIKAMHIECEHSKNYWDNQKYYKDNAKLLEDNGFVLMFFQRRKGQSDSFWVRKEFVK